MNLLDDFNYLTDDKEDGVANYLVSLYERTVNKYKYYPTKLNRLLTIYKLCTLKYNDWCLSDGFIINEDGTMRMPRWAYSPFYNDYSLIEEDKCEITDNLEIFDVQRPAISKHLKNIFEDGELDKNQVCSKMEHTATDRLLKFRRKEILKDFGRISHKQAINKANKEYEKYRIIQDKQYISSMDEMYKKYLNDNKNN